MYKHLFKDLQKVFRGFVVLFEERKIVENKTLT